MSQPNANRYMDMDATSHMTSTNGNLSSYLNFSNQNNIGIIVGSGQPIPIRDYGHTYLSSPTLFLKNIVLAYKLINDLIPVRKFTTYNSVTVEFDPHRFFEKGISRSGY